MVWNTAQTVGRVIGDQRHLDWVVIEDGSLVWRDYLSLPDTHAVPISAIPGIPSGLRYLPQRPRTPMPVHR